MDVSAMITYLRGTTGTNVNNYPEDLCVVDLNIAYHEIEDAIVKRIGEKYLWDRLVSDGVAAQSEYTFDSSISGNLKGVNKTYGVSIDYGGTGDFVKATEKDTDLLEHDPSYYETNQSEESPFYEIKDNSLFIYPAPTDNVSVIRHYVARGLADLAASTDEADVFNGKIPSKYHYVVALGAREHAFMRRRLENDAQNAKNTYKDKLDAMISALNTRNVSAKRRGTVAGFQVNPL